MGRVKFPIHSPGPEGVDNRGLPPAVPLFKNCFICMVLSLMIIQMTISWSISSGGHSKHSLCRLDSTASRSTVGNSNTEGRENCKLDHVCSYSWSGQRKMPSYSSRLVFPETFWAALRTIAMKEDELFQVSLLLEEVVQTREGRQPSDSEVQAAVWKACGDSGALQILVDLLNMRMTDLQESSGKEDCDTSLLENEHITESATQQNENNLSCSGQTNSVSRHKSVS